MAVWQCRLLLSIVLLHLVLTSPVVRRDIQLLDNATPLSGEPAEVVGEDAFGPVLESRGGREKRLLKTLGLGALGVKAAKAVGTKVVAGSVKALGAKAGAVVKAAAGGALAVKAKALGVKTVTAVAALGLKALIVKLLFGLTKSSLPSSRQQGTTVAPATTGDDQIPEFDPNKISLQVPDELFAPAFTSVNNISVVIGNLIQGTAERIARLVERLKPILRSSLGFRSQKREAVQAEDPLNKENDTTYFTNDNRVPQGEDSVGAESHSPIKAGFTALSDSS